MIQRSPIYLLQKSKTTHFFVSNSFNEIKVTKKVKHVYNFTRYVYNSFVIIIDMKTLSDRKRIHYKRILSKEIPTVISLHPPVADLLVLFGETLYIYTLYPNYVSHFSQIFPKCPWWNCWNGRQSSFTHSNFKNFYKDNSVEMLLKWKIQFSHSVMHSFGWEFGHVMNLAMGTERIYIIKGIARVYSSPERAR